MVARIFLLALIVLVSSARCSLAEDPAHVAIVVGTHHYSAHRSMPIFAKELERRGFKVSLVMGEGDPEQKTENVLPGIEGLQTADVAILYLRFLQLPDEEWKHLNDYLKSGKPIIALRTTNHSVKYPADHSRAHWNTNFGTRVVGSPYVAHQSTKTNVAPVQKYKTHPIMTGVVAKSWESPAKLYLTRLEPGCIPLMIGEGQGRPRLLEKGFGTVQVNRSETDIVAWTWQNEWGAKVFSTTLGHAGDFAHESFTRMLINSVYWSLDRETPASEKIPAWKIEMEVPSKYQPRTTGQSKN